MAPRHYLYRNLNKNCFSHLFRGKVVGYPTVLRMESVQFRVSEPGRKRVIKEQTKNVHAKVSGISLKEVSINEFDLELYEEVYYCPYSCIHF